MIPSCSICGDLFTGISPEIIHVTKCGHLFHYHCLSKWITRAKTCPHCRATVTEGSTIRVYMEGANNLEFNEADPAFLTNRVESLNFQITLKDTEIKKLTTELEKQKNTLEQFRRDFKQTNSDLQNALKNIQVLHDYAREKKVLKEELKKQTDRVTSLQNELKTYEKIWKILKGSSEQAGEAINSLSDLTNQQITEACVSALKREVKEYKERHAKAQAKIAQLRMNQSNICSSEYRKPEIQQQHFQNQRQHSKDDSSSNKTDEQRDLLLLYDKVETPTFSQSVDSADPFLRLSPLSPRLKGIKSRMLLSKPRLDFQKRLATTDCFDGLGGHSKEDSFDKIRLGISNKACIPAAKKLKPSSQQTNLLSAFLRTSR